MTEEELQRFIRGQRDLGMAQVNIMLDELCEHYGWDPVKVWREPHYRRLDALARWRASEMVGMSIMRPFGAAGIISGI